MLARTAGRGVDVVLNSLAGDAIARGISILKPYGRFLEIGKRDIYTNRSLGLSPFRRNLSFFAIDLDRLCAERPEVVGRMLREVIERVDAGTFTALPAQIFPVSEIDAAFRLVAQAKHIGKVVLSTASNGFAVSAGSDTHPRVRDDGTYLVTGGLGGFGLAVAHWLVARGARALAGRAAAYSLLRTRGLIRVEIPVPEGADFEVVSVTNAYGCSSTSNLSMYRRPLPSAASRS